MQSHRYSALLDFDRLPHLISLPVQHPGLGHLQGRDPEGLQRILSVDSLPVFPNALAEICTVMTHQRGDLYADSDALVVQKTHGSLSMRT